MPSTPSPPYRHPRPPGPPPSTLLVRSFPSGSTAALLLGGTAVLALSNPTVRKGASNWVKGFVTSSSGGGIGGGGGGGGGEEGKLGNGNGNGNGNRKGNGKTPWREGEVLDDRGRVKARTVGYSSLAVSYTVTPDMADPTSRAFAGEVLKLMDVLAGVASKRHCGYQTVTISADRVIFLRDVRVGDLMHMVASVNRSWSSSMEIGVRCVREDIRTGEKAYACHAYFTFVAKAPPPISPTLPSSSSISSSSSSMMSSWLSYLLPSALIGVGKIDDDEKMKGMMEERVKVQVPEVIPETVLEQKRYLLASRRRHYRITTQSSSQPYKTTLSSFREECFEMSRKRSKDHVGGDESYEEGHESGLWSRVKDLEKEMVVESYIRSDPEVSITHSPSGTPYLVVSPEVLGVIPTNPEEEEETDPSNNSNNQSQKQRQTDPVRVPLKEVEAMAARRRSSISGRRHSRDEGSLSWLKGRDPNPAATMAGAATAGEWESTIIDSKEKDLFNISGTVGDADGVAIGMNAQHNALVQSPTTPVSGASAMTFSWDDDRVRERGSGGGSGDETETRTEKGTEEEEEEEDAFERAAGDEEKVVDMEETHAMMMHVVRPQHANSVNVLFGGEFMSWLEEVSIMAAHRVFRGPWVTVCIDSLLFRNSVQPGEAVYLRAFVLKSWSSSVEVYAMAQAESRTPPHDSRFVSEAFFTLAAIDPVTSAPMVSKPKANGHSKKIKKDVKMNGDGILKVRAKPGTAAEKMAEGANERREHRLREKRMLERLYA